MSWIPMVRRLSLALLPLVPLGCVAPGEKSEPAPAATTVAIDTPASGAMIRSRGDVWFAISASDDVVRVELRDGDVLLGDSASAPFVIRWPVAAGDNGNHTIRASGTTAHGTVVWSLPISVVVAIAEGDTTPPTVELRSPSTDDGEVSGGIMMSALAGDNVAVVEVRYYANDRLVGTSNLGDDYHVYVPAQFLDAGENRIHAVAQDGAGLIAVSDNHTLNAVTITRLPSGPSMTFMGAPETSGLSPNKPYCYKLMATDNIAAPQDGWPVIAVFRTGKWTGGFTFVDPDAYSHAMRFYAVGFHGDATHDGCDLAPAPPHDFHLGLTGNGELKTAFTDQSSNDTNARYTFDRTSRVRCATSVADPECTSGDCFACKDAIDGGYCGADGFCHEVEGGCQSYSMSWNENEIAVWWDDLPGEPAAALEPGYTYVAGLKLIHGPDQNVYRCAAPDTYPTGVFPADVVTAPAFPLPNPPCLPTLDSPCMAGYGCELATGPKATCIPFTGAPAQAACSFKCERPTCEQQATCDAWGLVCVEAGDGKRCGHDGTMDDCRCESGALP